MSTAVAAPSDPPAPPAVASAQPVYSAQSVGGREGGRREGEQCPHKEGRRERGKGASVMNNDQTGKGEGSVVTVL